MGPALRFQYEVPVVCRPHLNAVTNMASLVVGPGAPGTVSHWALPSSFGVKFILFVTQASTQRVAWPQLSESLGLKQRISWGPALQFQGQTSTVCFLHL